MPKNYIKLYFDDLDALAGLTPGEIGRLVTAVLEYARDGKEAELGGSERIIFPMFKLRVDRESAAYQKNAEIRAEAGRQGGRPKAEEKQTKANESKKKQMLSEKANESKKSYTIANSHNPIANSHSQETPYNPPLGDAFVDFAGDDPVLLVALKDYEAMRKKQRSPMTPRAKELLVGKLVEQPKETWIPMLEEATLKGWKSVYPPKQEQTQSQQPNAEADAFRSGPVFDNGRLERLRAAEQRKKGQT